VLSTRFNTCLPYFKVESKITRDFEAQCSLFTYKGYLATQYDYVARLNYVDMRLKLLRNTCTVTRKV